MFKKVPIIQQHCAAMEVSTVVVKSVPNGNRTLTSLERHNLCDIPKHELPPPETFSVDAYRRSGLPLDKVNTKVLTTRPNDEVINSINSALDSVEQPKTDE